MSSSELDFGNSNRRRTCRPLESESFVGGRSKQPARTHDPIPVAKIGRHKPPRLGPKSFVAWGTRRGANYVVLSKRYTVQKQRGCWVMCWSVYNNGKRSQSTHILGSCRNHPKKVDVKPQA